MKAIELKELLGKFDDNLEVYFYANNLSSGNIVSVNSAKLDSYGFFGKDVQCILLKNETEEVND